MTQRSTYSTSDDDLIQKINALRKHQVLVLTADHQVVIDGFTSDLPPDSASWTCMGTGVSFVRCTQKIVDNTGCAIVVPHEDGYCSKPCRD